MSARRQAGRERLDTALVRRGLVASRAKAHGLILAGRVTSGGSRVDKPGSQIALDADLEVLEGPRFVGRGGHKLAGALERFDVTVEAREALDVGASTGGFTQVLLEAGAGRVIALDVGRGQLDWGLRQDPRVVPLEGVNARLLSPDQLPYRPTLASVDVSFISLELVLPAVAACMRVPWDMIVLAKPQFEVGRRDVGKGGIVRDPRLHVRVLERLVGFAIARDYRVRDVCASPVRGAAGNREFFLHLASSAGSLAAAELEARIAVAVTDHEPEAPA